MWNVQNEWIAPLIEESFGIILTNYLRISIWIQNRIVNPILNSGQFAYTFHWNAKDSSYFVFSLAVNFDEKLKL